jgi:hypothetical protein
MAIEIIVTARGIRMALTLSMIDGNFDIERSKLDVVKTDCSRRSLYVYFEEEPGRRAAAKLLTATSPGALPPTSRSCRSLEGRRALNCSSCSVAKTCSGATLCTAVLL